MSRIGMQYKPRTVETAARVKALYAAKPKKEPKPKPVKIPKESKPKKPMSDETKAKLRAAKLGKSNGPLSEETRAKMSLAKLGVPQSFVRTPEHNKKIASALKGRPCTPERKAAIKAGFAKNNPDPLIGTTVTSKFGLPDGVLNRYKKK
jgi:hypothetical protein